jgi:DNA-binding LacI/PurR family transcriptional regulator
MNVTQRELARAAKVSQATVARVLRKDPGVSQALRAKVLEAVERCQYQQNPLVDAWASKFRANHRHAGLVLAHVSGYPETAYSSQPRLRRLRDSMLTHTATMEIGIEPFYCGPGGLGTGRLMDILLARGIQPVLYGPFPREAQAPDMDWTKLSVAAIGESPATEALHRIVHSRYLSMREALIALRAKGFQRTGLIISGPREEAIAERGWLPAVLRDSSNRPTRERVPWLHLKGNDKDAVRQWVRKYQPDAVLSPSLYVAPWLKSLQPAPLFIGLDLDIPPDSTTGAGIVYPAQTIAQAAVDMLIAKHDLHDLGKPAHGQIHSYFAPIEGLD